MKRTQTSNSSDTNPLEDDGLSLIYGEQQVTVETLRSYLPSWRRMPVVRKPIADPLVDVTEGHHPGRRARNGRCYEVCVAERRLGVDSSWSGHRRTVDGRISIVVGRSLGVPAADETTEPTSLDVEPTEPAHLRQTALKRVRRTLGVVGHVESSVA